MSTIEFLRLMWPDGVPDGARLVVSSPEKNGKRWASETFQLLEGAAEALVAKADRYVSLAAMRGDLPPGKRGGSKDAVALPGLYLDLDIRGPGHKKTALPADETEALALAAAFPIEPSIVLASGGGLYLVWAFEVPWIFANDRDRERAASLSKRWQANLLAIARARGFDLDSTHDLARVLRAPGCQNAKYDPPREVRVIASTGKRYTIEEIEAKIPPPTKRARTAARRTQTGHDQADLLDRVAAALGGATKRDEDYVVFRRCPLCRGAQSDGTIAAGTAHVGRALILRCFRASCEAADGGLDPDAWIGRVLPDTQAAELRALRAEEAPDGGSTEFDAARDFVGKHGRDLRYYAGLGGWLVFDGRRWKPDRANAARRAHASIESFSFGFDPEICAKLQRASTVQAVLKLAESQLVLDVGDFDRDPWLLNVLNGTLDVRTGNLREHRRGDMLAKLADVEFHPDATCEDWNRYVDHVTGGSAAYAAWLQRAFGYSLTGDVREDAVFIVHGRLANEGKSTLFGLVADTLGQYARTITFGALLAKERNADGPRPELATLPGVRIALASEAREQSPFDAATLKSLAGGDPITIRALYLPPFTFRPAAKFWLACNRVPPLAVADPGMERRLRVIPFAYPFPLDGGDKGARDRMRKSARTRAAFLAWALRGALAWQRDGLGSCGEVDLATTAYFEGARSRVTPDETVERFLVERCEFGTDFEERSRALAEALTAFAQRTSLRTPSLQAMAAALRARSCAAVHREAGNRWKGVRLKPEAFSETVSQRAREDDRSEAQHENALPS